MVDERSFIYLSCMCQRWQDCGLRLISSCDFNCNDAKRSTIKIKQRRVKLARSMICVCPRGIYLIFLDNGWYVHHSPLDCFASPLHTTKLHVAPRFQINRDSRGTAAARTNSLAKDLEEMLIFSHWIARIASALVTLPYMGFISCFSHTYSCSSCGLTTLLVCATSIKSNYFVSCSKSYLSWLEILRSFQLWSFLDHSSYKLQLTHLCFEHQTR